MIDKYNDSDWLWIYIIINNEKKYITQEESDLIDNRYSYNETTWEFYKGEKAEEYEKDMIKTQIQQIESQMPILRTQRDWLEETITYGLEAPWDATRLEAIKSQLITLATERKELYEKIAELDLS